MLRGLVSLLVLSLGGVGCIEPTSETVAGAAGSSGASGGAGASQGELQILSASFERSAEAPLGGALLVATSSPARVKATLRDESGHTLTLSLPKTGTLHALPVLGLRAGRLYAATITAESEDGTSSKPTTLVLQTPSLPIDLPAIEVIEKDPARPGVTLMPVSRFLPDGSGVDGSWGYILGFDGAGEVVFWVPTGVPLSDVRKTMAGDIRFLVGDTGLVDMTPLGQGLRAWAATALLPANQPLIAGVHSVAADTIHHDAIELPDGHILALSTERRTVTQASCPGTYDKDYEVVGDVVIEIDPSSGEVLHRTSMFDLLDPCRRVDAFFKGAFWSSVYGTPVADWTHANALFHDVQRNAVLVSLRHADWVVAFRHQEDAEGPAGQLLYRFGPEGDFSLEGPGSFPYHQHAVSVLQDGHLMLFDNGTNRPGTVDNQIDKLPVSRAVEYALDMAGPKGTWKAQQVWEYGPEEVRQVDTSTGASIQVGYYSAIVGGAEVTPEGTVLILQGALPDPPNGLIFDPTAKKWIRVLEVEKETKKLVLDVRLKDPASVNFISYLGFRATRISTLYPASWGVEASVSPGP